MQQFSGTASLKNPRTGPRDALAGGAIRQFRKNLRALEREIARSLASETECCGVTMAQCHLLLEVAERGRTGITELSDALELDKSTLSRSVDSLWNAGLLSRDADPLDRRQQLICLTDKGRGKVDAINKLCDDSAARLFRHIPNDKRSLVQDVVAVLAGAMRKNRASPDGRCSRPADASDLKEGRDGKA